MGVLTDIYLASQEDKTGGEDFDKAFFLSRLSSTYGSEFVALANEETLRAVGMAEEDVKRILQIRKDGNIPNTTDPKKKNQNNLYNSQMTRYTPKADLLEVILDIHHE